jgi:hypothetical protein
LRIDLNEGDVNCNNRTQNNSDFSPIFPKPTAYGYFEAFAGIMFAFGGASTFPTIQADMANKASFKWAAVLALGSMKYFCSNNFILLTNFKLLNVMQLFIG